MTKRLKTNVQELEPFRILLIDDNPDDRDHIRRLLLRGARRRLHFVEAASGEKGISACREIGSFDCIVLDMHLCDMNGFEVLEELRNDTADGITPWPVVVMTGSGGDFEPADVMRAGAQDYIGKEWASAEGLSRAVDNAVERYAMTRDLRESEARLRLALSSGKMGTWDRNFQTGRVVWSDEHYRMMGYRPGEVEPSYENWARRVHIGDVPKVDAALRKARVEKSEFVIEYRVVWADGTMRWIELRGRYDFDASGTVRRMYGIVLDMTEHKQAEEALCATEERLRLAQEAAGIGIWDWDIGTGGIRWSEQNYRLHGIAQEHAPPTYENWRMAIHPEDRDRANALVTEAVATGREYEAEYRVVLQDGTTRWLAGQGRVFLDEANRPARMVGINFDITERRNAATHLAQMNEELERRVAERTAQLVQAQKMEIFGQMTGGVAHDFNNLLAVVLSNMELLRKRLPADPIAKRLIDGAVAGAERGAALTQRMLSFARRQELRLDAVDLPSLVAGTDNMLSRTLGPGVGIATKFDPDLPQVQADANQLELALLNLAVNARDAMPLGGTMTVSARKAVVPADGGTPSLTPGEYGVLTVSDTGVGMDAATLARATEPFFTTKGPGQGTGLGLPMVFGLAAQSKGALNLISQPRVGTTAELWLPRASISSAASGESVATGVLNIKSCNVLLVDDDVLIGMSTQMTLEDLGHSVIVVLSGENALSVLRDGAAVDIVVTDQAMPGMTGLELVGRIKAEWPALPVLLATGYDELPGDNNVPRLMKPYKQEVLAARIAELVGTVRRGNENVVSLRSKTERQ
jgi:PAS domain S-box-containing protein